MTLRARKVALEKGCLSCWQDKGRVRGKERIFQIKSQAGTESCSRKRPSTRELKKKNVAGEKGTKGTVEQDEAGKSVKGQTMQSQGGTLTILFSSKSEMKPIKTWLLQ